MPRRDTDDLFRDERPEWTARNHRLLERCAVPTATKLGRYGKPVALVDGYSGANAYGGEMVGSTAIMVKAALKLRASGGKAVVHACEPDPRRHAALVANLAEHVESGLLRTHQARHAEAVDAIQAETEGWPAMVFLDPQAVTDMTLERDVAPWGRRPKTDVLGVFMAGQACRCCGQIRAQNTRHAVMPESYLGPGWEAGHTEDGAHDVFLGNVRGLKRFAGMYRLRKRDSQQEAYGIFGLSDHADGYWLLSRAVAMDYGRLKEFDFSKHGQLRLFEDDPVALGHKADFTTLVDLARTTILQNPKLRGAKLAARLFDLDIGVQELFGTYEEPDYTTAAYHVLGLPDRRPRAQGE